MSTRRWSDTSRRAKQAYLESRVQGASQLEMLVMLYEGAEESVTAGARLLREQHLDEATEALAKARRIITYLSNSLMEEGGEISEQLRRLYAFCFERISKANLTKDPADLEGVADVIRELSGGWRDLAASQDDKTP